MKNADFLLLRIKGGGNKYYVLFGRFKDGMLKRHDADISSVAGGRAGNFELTKWFGLSLIPVLANLY